VLRESLVVMLHDDNHGVEVLAVAGASGAEFKVSKRKPQVVTLSWRLHALCCAGD